MNIGEDAIELPDLTKLLPDDVIEKILQSLPIRDSVGTSILSTEWKDKWKTISSLVFDEFHTNLASIITKILTQHTSHIQSFRFHFLYPELTNVSESIILEQYVNVAMSINAWINILKEKSIKYLSIEMDLGLPCFINESLFACDKIEVLKLSICTLHPPPSYSKFEHLKKLHLEEVNITEKEFEEFSSKCPVLENLTIINVDMDTFQVSKNPKLVYLHIQGIFYELFLENVQGIKFLFLHLSYEIEDVDRLDQRGTSNLSTIFATLTGIEKVELLSDSIKYLAAGNVHSKLPFMLNHLKEMCLAIDFMDLNDIAVALSLIRSSPNLEILRINVSVCRPSCSMIASHEFWEKQYRVNIKFKCLKTVVVEEITSWVHNQIQLCFYICNQSPALPRIEYTRMSEDNSLFYMRDG